MTRYIIIGMGIAGISAAETLRRLDQSAEIVMISDDHHGYYSRPGLAYSLNGEIPEKYLYPFTGKDWKALDLRCITGRVTHLDQHAHQIEVDPSGPLKYGRLLLATGANAVPLNVPGKDLKGVVKLDHLEDERLILSSCRHARTAVVVGGGVIALELIEGLIAHKIKVHYLLRGDRYWTNVLDEAESRLIENRLVEDGVVLHFHTEIAQIQGRAGRVAAVQTTQNEIIPCKMVAVGVGVKPRMQLAQEAGLKTERGILTDEFLQTSAADIYAAGDAAQIFDLTTKHALIDNLWHPGREQGRIAAINMAGQRQPYYRTVAVNVLRLAGLMITIIGAVGSGRDEDLVSVARGSSETWQQLPNTLAMENSGELSHVRLMVGERTLLGALVMGDQKLSLPLQEMIAAQTDISPIRSQLLQPGIPLGQVVMDFWSRIKQ